MPTQFDLYNLFSLKGFKKAATGNVGGNVIFMKHKPIVVLINVLPYLFSSLKLILSLELWREILRLYLLLLNFFWTITIYRFMEILTYYQYLGMKKYKLLLNENKSYNKNVRYRCSVEREI